MPRQTLIYKVTVDSGNRDGDRVYLQKLRETFRMISEELVTWGYTHDESISHSLLRVEMEAEGATDVED